MNLTTLYIDRHVAELPLTLSIQTRLNIPHIVVNDAKEIFSRLSQANDPVEMGKKNLYLTRNRGAFIKKCPGTRFYTCCGYQILHIGSFCTMDCSYCILQQYFHPPLLQFFVNHDDMLGELDALFLKPTVTRIGTGEFTDSLIWEQATDLSALLIPRFAGQSRTVLELKTKTKDIEKIKGLPHGRKTIMAWSLNTEKMIQTDERRTASLAQRIEAAAACERHGYPLAFHFDPMVIYDGWETDYQEVIRRLFSEISPENVVWISIGAFRFVPPLKEIIQKRFSRSKIVYGEFVPGMDGKMRYFKPLRIDMYQKMVSWFREVAPNVLVYYCMEDDEVWERTMGFKPESKGGLSRMLDESAIRHCGLTH